MNTSMDLADMARGITSRSKSTSKSTSERPWSGCSQRTRSTSRLMDYQNRWKRMTKV
jgi:hypothetical protein